jgi:hypothetical protein
VLARDMGIPFVLTPFHHPRWSSWLFRVYHELYRSADAVLALTEAERTKASTPCSRLRRSCGERTPPRASCSLAPERQRRTDCSAGSLTPGS